MLMIMIIILNGCLINVVQKKSSGLIIYSA